MKCLFLSRDDWARASWTYAKALHSVGVEAEAVTQNPHGFSYSEEARVIPKEKWGKEVPKLIEWADVVVNMHGINLSGALQPPKHALVFQGGSWFRANPPAFNTIFNPFVSCSIIQTGDLLGHGAKNEVWILPPIDLEKIRPQFGIWGKKISVAHYPRSFNDKGGAHVTRVMDKLLRDPELRPNFTFTCTEEKVEWPDSIKRMGECDIYIEAMAPTHLGKKHGAWGYSALEASALGKVVVTNFLDVELYEKVYGKCGLQVANTEDELEAVMRRLLKMSRHDLENLQVDTREWAEKFHSFEAVGERLKAAIRHYCYGEHDQRFSPGFATLNTGYYDPKSFWESRGHIHGCVGDVTREELYQVFSWLHQCKVQDAPILEVGSGQGATYAFLKAAGAKLPQYRMVDFVQSCRYKAKQLTGVLPDGWDGKKLPYGDGEFEAVICTDVLLHVPERDIGTFVAECVRVAGQYLIVSSYTGRANEQSDDLAFHSFIHDYDEIWKQNRLSVVGKKVTGGGTRAVWLLAK